MLKHDKDEFISARIQSKWKVYMDRENLNAATKKDHFPLP